MAIIHVHCDTNQCHDLQNEKPLHYIKIEELDFHPNVTVDYQNLYYYTENI